MGNKRSPLRQLAIPAILLSAFLSAQTAWADIDIIINPHNPITRLSRQDLRRIFLGRMPLFPQTTREIHPIDLPDDNATFIEFYRRVVKLEGIRLKRYRVYYLFSGRGRLPEQAKTPKDVINRVATDPAAIGYVDKRDINATVKILLVLPGSGAH